MKKVWLYSSFLLMITACTSLQNLANLSKPSLSVSNVRITDFNFNEVELTYDVKVHNPNPVALHMQSYDYHLKIDGNDFVKGTQDKNLNIASSANSTVEIPMRLNFRDLYNLFGGLRNEQKADYNLAAHLNFNLPAVGNTSFPIKKSGSIPLIKLPKISLSSVKVDDINLSRARMHLKLKVDNPNGFGLLMNALSYSLNVNGKHWINGNNEKNITINKNSSKGVSIPVTLNIAQIGSSVIQLLRGSNKANYNLKGRINFGATQQLLRSLNTNFSFNKSGAVSLAH